MVFEYANRWFKISVEIFGFRRQPALRKYTVDCVDASRAVKDKIVRNISAQVKADIRSMRL